MKTTIKVYLKNGECLHLSQDEELSMGDIDLFLRQKGDFCIFPKSKYHDEDVFIHQTEIVYITSLITQE